MTFPQALIIALAVAIIVTGGLLAMIVMERLTKMLEPYGLWPYLMLGVVSLGAWTLAAWWFPVLRQPV